MAKKDRLKNLLGAITESPVQEQPQEEVAASTMDQENRVASEVVKELGISPEMEDQLNEIRRAKTGRPKEPRNSTASTRAARTATPTPSR